MNIPVNSAEVKLVEDIDDGLRVECSEKMIPMLQRVLTDAGFKCQKHSVSVVGTKNIHAWVQFGIARANLLTVENKLEELFNELEIPFKKERIGGLGEKSVIFHLTNISVYDR